MLCLQCSKRRQFGDPGVVGGFVVDDDHATHVRMPDTAELGAKDVEPPGACGREPHLRDHARHHVHPRAERRDIEIVQNVFCAQQQFHRLADEQMQLGDIDDAVVLIRGVFGVETERIVDGDIGGIGTAETTVRAGQAETPLPLLPNDLDDARVGGGIDELGIDEKPRREHRGNANGGDADQPAFETTVMGFVSGPMAVAVAIAEDRPGNEKIDDNEGYAGNDQRNGEGVVHLAPVRRRRGQPPRAPEVEGERGGDDDDQEDGERQVPPQAAP